MVGQRQEADLSEAQAEAGLEQRIARREERLRGVIQKMAEARRDQDGQRESERASAGLGDRRHPGKISFSGVGIQELDCSADYPNRLCTPRRRHGRHQLFLRRPLGCHGGRPEARAIDRRARTPRNTGMVASGAGLHADVDQRPAGDLRRRRGPRDRRRGDADRILGRAGRDARADRRIIRRLAPCRAAGARQRPSPFLPDADARPPAGDQQDALSLARRALSDLGAPEARSPAARGAARARRASDVGLHDGGRPSLPLPGVVWRTRSTSRSRRRSSSACG